MAYNLSVTKSPIPPERKSGIELDKLALVLAYGILFTAGLLNLAVVFVIPYVRSLRKTQNIQIFNICLASLIYCSGLPTIISVHLKRSWVLGWFVCKLVISCEAIGKHAIILFITLAAVERYVCVCQPVVYTQICSMRNIGLVSVCGWLIATIFTTPLMIYSETITFRSRNNHSPHFQVCTVSYPSRQMSESFFCATFTALFLLPLSLILASYATIFLKFKKSGQNVAKPSITRNPPNFDPFRSQSLSVDYSQMAQHSPSQTPSATPSSPLIHTQNRVNIGRAVTRMILALISCFILGWSPYWVLSFLVTYQWVYPTSLGLGFVVIHMLPYASCGLNPLLYLFLTDHFKASIRKSWLVKKRRRQYSLAEEGPLVRISARHMSCFDPGDRMDLTESSRAKTSTPFLTPDSGPSSSRSPSPRHFTRGSS